MGKSVKPGILTSEFWFSLPAMVTGLLVMSGVVDPVDSDFISESIRTIVAGMLSLGAVIFYLTSRTSVKNSVDENTTIHEISKTLGKEKPNVELEAEATLG